MAENSKIEWTDHTFNPWIGCTKVSAACDHCYAEVATPTRTLRASGAETWGPHAPRKRTSAANWKKPLAWNRKAEYEGRRYRVFCASLADVFDNHASILPEWRADLWELIAETTHLDWLLLTKRPQNINRMLPHGWNGGWPNVWLGTTVENQTEADRRIPHLLAAPATVRFLSCEPLLGPVDLTRWSGIEGDGGTMGFGLDWVICGGESGPGARPMHPDWARSLRDQCVAAGVPFFFKQWGEWGHTLHMQDVEAVSAAPAKNGNWAHPRRYRIHGGPEDGQCFESLPEDHLMLRVGKARAGRLLDGRTWDELPEDKANG